MRNQAPEHTAQKMLTYPQRQVSKEIQTFSRRTHAIIGGHTERVNSVNSQVRLYEPFDASGIQFHVEEPGPNFRHPVTPGEVVNRLAELPKHVFRQVGEKLDHVAMPALTKKLLRKPSYGMQCKGSVYLFPVESSGIMKFGRSMDSAQRIELETFGARLLWNEEEEGWDCHWSEETLRLFYLQDVLLHEVGHVLDRRNRNTRNRERYANNFAIQYRELPKSRGKQRHQERGNRRHGH